MLATLPVAPVRQSPDRRSAYSRVWSHWHRFATGTRPHLASCLVHAHCRGPQRGSARAKSGMTASRRDSKGRGVKIPFRSTAGIFGIERSNDVIGLAAPRIRHPASALGRDCACAYVMRMPARASSPTDRPRRATNVSLDPRLIDEARAPDVNVLQACERACPSSHDARISQGTNPRRGPALNYVAGPINGLWPR